MAVLAPFMPRRIRLSRRWLGLGALIALSCGDAAAGEQGTECDEPGRSSACDCADATRGTQLCLGDGTFGACSCQAVRTVPCSAPGVGFPCSCASGSNGMEFCRIDGRYTDCDCERGSELSQDAGGQEPPSPGTKPEAPQGCPSGFTCVEQMGVRACADASGLPPLCTSDADCTAAGLADATCVDPMIGGVLVCFQAC